MKKVLLILLALSICVVSNTFAQSRKITGKVTSAEDSQPLPGVTVKVTGGSTSTQTNAQGEYSINVADNVSSLTFSYIGYTNQVIKLSGQTVVDAKLASNTRDLGEVVVTSYTTQKRSELTGSVASISGKDIEKLPIVTFDQALQGRAAGVQVTTNSGQPGSGISVNIRGVATINGSTSPLYVIDGVQVNQSGLSGLTTQNALGTINPQDIESIEVIKDAATASIYGSQAGNGVVIVTTKRGKAGKTQLRASAQLGVSKELNPYETLDANQYYQLRAQAARNKALIEGTPVATAIANLNAEVLPYIGSGNLTSIPADIPSTDWYNLIFRNGQTRLYNFSANGGDARTKFFISGSYNGVGGTIIGSDYKKGTLRANIENRATDQITIETSINVSGALSTGPTTQQGFFTNTAFTGTLFTPPINMPYNADGSYRLPYPYGDNLLQDLTLEKRSTGTFQTLSHLALNYTPIKGLTARAYAGIDFSSVRDYNYRPASIPGYAATNGTGTEIWRRNINWNASGTVTYAHTFNEDHHFQALGGVEYRELNNNTFSGAGQNFSSPLLTLLSSASTYTSITSTNTGYKLFSYLGNIKYDYKGKYLFDGNIRDDGSSRFGANNKFGLFGGVSVGWILSREDFLKDVSFLSNLKIRGSYGLTGVQPVGDFDFLDKFTPPSASGGYLGNGSIRQTALGNPDLAWEKSTQKDIGIDFGFFNNRITGSVDVYTKNNSNLLLYVTVPTSSGFGSILQNLGKVDAKGLDFDLSTVNVDLKGFQWSTNFNFALTRNKVKELYNGLQFITVNRTRDIQVGQPLNIYYYYKYAGVNPADGRPLYLDKNNNLTYNPVEGDQKNVGDTNPKFFGGFGNTFTYKGLSLDVLFQYQYGNSAQITAGQVLEAGGAGSDNQLVSQLNSWSTPGQITSNPRPYANFEVNVYDPTNFTSRYIQTASYIRLKNVTLNYKLPSSLTKKIGIPSVSVFVQGVNLTTFTNYRGQDPENSTNNNLNSYPNPKSITGGITLDL